MAAYGLPTAPATATDLRSRSWRGETCQLEALPPDALAEIVDAAISEQLVPELVERQVAAGGLDRDALLRELPA